MNALLRLKDRVIDVLDPAGDWVALLPIRLLMAYEFGRAGLMKYNGTNWFANVQDNFPFPFNVIPVEISWHLSCDAFAFRLRLGKNSKILFS